MRLTAKVLGVLSGDRFTDGKQRVEFRVNEADTISNDLRIVSEAFALNEEVTLFVVPGRVEEIPTTYDQAMAIIDESVRRQQERNVDEQAPQNGLHVVKGGADGD